MALPTIRVASLCAGVGGLDIAVRLALPGARTILYVEREFAAAAVLAQRMEDGALDCAPIYSDLATFDSERWRGSVDLIVAGFPCPDYSVAGKRAGRFGKHGQVWDYVRESIRGIRPAAVFLENVSGILVPHEHVAAGIEYVLGDLAAIGFDAEWESVRASDVGAPHRRERWFCLAYSRRERDERWRADQNIQRTEGEAAGQTHQRERGWYTVGDGIPNVAHDPGRGCGVLRESPGGAGQPDRDGEAVEDPGCARIGWPAQPSGITGTGTSGNDCGAGRELVCDPVGSRLEGRTGQPSDTGEERPPAERAGGSDVDDPAGARSVGGQPRQSAETRDEARLRELSGRRDAMEDPARDGEPGCQRETGRGRGRGVCETGEQLADPDEDGCGGTCLHLFAREPCNPIPDLGGTEHHLVHPECAEWGAQRIRQDSIVQRKDRDREEDSRVGESEPSSIPLFPPAPNDRDGWARVLTSAPWLAPAVEPGLHVLVDGVAYVVDASRTDQLRACGNGVVPLQAAAALTRLIRRMTC